MSKAFGIWLVGVLLLAGCQAQPAGPKIDEWGWKWPAPAAPSVELEQALQAYDSPQAVARHLKRDFTFTVDYDYTVFMAPDEFVKRRRGACTAYARYWLAALDRLGLQGDFVVAFGPATSHAMVVFKDHTGVYRMVSNDAIDEARDLDPDRLGLDAAAMGAARAFYGDAWRAVAVLDDRGQLRRQLLNPQAPTKTPPAGGQGAP